MKRLDAIGVVEACYRPCGDAAWAGGLLEALAPLDQGGGAMAVQFDLKTMQLRALVRRGNLPDVDQLIRAYQEAPIGIIRSHLRPCPPVDRASFRGADQWPPLRDTLATAGMDDAVGIMSVEHDGQAFFVWTPIRAASAPAPRTLQQLGLVTAHIVTARRLRARSPAEADPLSAADAILTPDGAVQDAVAGASEARTRGELREAVRRIERARGRARREDPEGALAVWRGLVDGEWSLVDHVDTDGRRFVLARKNPPGVRDPKALAPRERDVLGYAVLGHSNKFIGYMLGLAPTTVATHLAAAQRKLGAASRVELVALLAPRGRA